jgi:hypothetical protein
LRRRVTGGTLLLLGIGFTTWSVQLVTEAHGVKAWPTTLGVVTRSDIDVVAEPTDVATPAYSARVEYSYAIGSRSFSGQRITFADHSSSSRTEMTKRVQRYPVGSAVTVYYDPVNPARAMLEMRVAAATYGPLLPGLVAVAAGVVALFAPGRPDRAVGV